MSRPLDHPTNLDWSDMLLVDTELDFEGHEENHAHHDAHNCDG